MSKRFEKWLDRRTPVNEDEMEFSEEARERIYSRRQGPVVVPKGAIIQADSFWYRVSSPAAVGEADAYTSMEEDEVGSGMEVVDARILGGPGTKYDATFQVLRSTLAERRQEHITQKARSYKRLAALGGAFALGLIWAAANLPLPRLVGEANCYEATNDGQYIERADGFSPPAIRDAATCELGGHEYVIMQSVQR